ncbi:MAG: GatB/YqeY domain-containing protein [Candidatus Colwellbacteria bacterium]
MILVDQLKIDTTQALKGGEALKVETLRGLLAAVHNREIELKGKGEELSEEEVLTVLGREAKKRKEANQIYSEAGRVELAEKESRELEIIKSYLPPEMGSDEIEVIVRKVVGDGVTEFGRVMGAVVKETKGRAEPGLVKGIVEKILDISK